MTTDEQKRVLILKALFDTGIQPNSNVPDAVEKIIESLKQFDPEPLEVEIKQYGEFGNAYLTFYSDGEIGMYPFRTFETKQEAQAFCAKHGLRVKQ